MKKKKKKTLRILGNSLFVLLLAGIIAFGFYDAKTYLEAEKTEMEAYEASLPKYALDDYIASLTEDKWRELAAPTLAMVNTDVQTEDECFEYLIGYIGDAFRYAPGEGENEYIIFNNDYILGSITLNSTIGNARPEIIEESYDFSFIFRSEKITAPEGYPVFFGDCPLTEKYITSSDIEYEYLRFLYRKTDMSLPHMCSYEISNVFGEKSLNVKTPDGEVFDVTSIGDGSSLFTPVEDEDAVQIRYLSEFFLREYVPMACGMGGNPYLYITIDSPLWDRFRRVEGLYYHTASYSVSQVEANAVLRVSDELCVADISYDTVGVTNKAASTIHHNVKMLFINGPGVQRIETFTEY